MPENDEKEKKLESDIEADLKKLDEELGEDSDENSDEYEQIDDEFTEEPANSENEDIEDENILEEDLDQSDESKESEMEQEGDEWSELQEEISDEPIELTPERAESDEILESTRNRNILEGALFVAGRPVSIEELQMKTDFKKAEIEAIIQELMLDYMERPTALEIVMIQDKFSLQIKPEYTPKVKKFASGGLIPDAILKTLTIIALKQPIAKSMLIKLRGSTAYDHVKFLVDRGYVLATKKGRSFELITTDQFSDTFGLSRDITTLKKQMITQLGVQED